MALKKEVAMCNVYATCIENERKILWDFIVSSQNSFPYTWCLWGGGWILTWFSTDRKE